ncbi:MAG TPA: hypothetical protein VGL99_12470 [Chloroflexota bacterium]
MAQNNLTEPSVAPPIATRAKIERLVTDVVAHYAAAVAREVLAQGCASCWAW